MRKKQEINKAKKTRQEFNKQKKIIFGSFKM
jgi:hypothetical protein